MRTTRHFSEGSRLLVALLALLVLGLANPAAALYAAPQAQIAPTFNYQGTLRDAQGNLVNGNRDMTFRIYDATNELYSERIDDIPVRDGIFNVVLGDAKTLPASVFAAGPRYIGVTVDPDAPGAAEMIPRQRVHPVPWAQQATSAQTATTLVPNATVNGLTVNGTLTFNHSTFGWRMYPDATGLLRIEERNGGFLRLGLNQNGNVLIPGDLATRSVSLDSGTKIDGAGANVVGKVIASAGFSGHCVTGAFNPGVVGDNLNVTCNSDVAETFGTDERTEPGDLVVFIPEDRTFPAVQLSTQPYEGAIVGVVSTDPGLVFDQGETRLSGDNSNLITDNKTVVAMVGRVPTKFSLENGPIAVGDPLTSSSTPGTAMKATQAGRIIGYAMQSSDAAEDGKILVWLQLSTHIPEDALAAINGAASAESVADATTIAHLEAQVAALTQQVETLKAGESQTQWPWGLSLFGGLLAVGAVVGARHWFRGTL